MFHSNSKKISKVTEHLARMYESFLKAGPAKTLVVGFALIIFIGGILLAMPFASKSGESIGLLNAFFTATSAVCVTGLAVVNTTYHWTLFGKIVILVLIQIGGLGFMSMVTAVFLMFNKKITLKDRLLIKESYNQNNLSGMVRLVRSVFKGTLIIEGVSAFILSLIFIWHGESFFGGIWKGIFISISAFCNAGFDILGDSSLIPYQSNVVLNLVVMFLITIGGIGFAVWMDVIKIKDVITKDISFKLFVKRLAVHTKIVLLTSFILVSTGALFTFFIEYSNPGTLGPMSMGTKILSSLFQAVTLRTAGFNSFDISNARNSTQFLYIIQMFIGGSPGGTAGGIKTATIAVIIIAIMSALRGKNKLDVFHKNLKIDILFKALTVIMLNLIMVIVATMLLTISEGNNPAESFRFLDYFFEATSAVGTVGLTLGVTPHLSVFGKLIIIFCMFFGRLGPITIGVAFAIRADETKNIFNYPDEKVLVG